MNTHTPASRQRGLALAVVLILLLVMSLLGLASMRSTLLQERMSGNLTDRGLSFQAAEAALRQGETDVTATSTAIPVPASGSDCRAAKSCPLVPSDWTTAKTKTLTTPVFNKTAQPQYQSDLLAVDVEPTPEEKTQVCPQAVDLNAPECSVTWRIYRITARSTQADRAAVMLQSIYKVR